MYIRSDPMQDFEYMIGTHPFTAVCFSADGKFSMGLSVETADNRWTEVFGRKSVVVDPAVVLSALTSFWNKIAGPFAGQSPSRFSFDLSLLVGPLPNGKVNFVRDGLFVTFESQRGTKALESESVIPVEVLLAVGNLLASFTPTHLAEMWRRVSAPTELPAFPVLDMEMNQSDEDAKRENEWYARALGQPLDYYERLANWLHARQLAYAVGAEGYSEPSREEYDVANAPETLPSMTEIDAVYGLSIGLMTLTIEEVREQAIAGRNYSVRDANVFRKFFPR